MKQKKYKYYVYYDDHNKIYAYTDDKSISNLFDQQRNFDFYKKKILHISKDEVNYLAQKYYNETLRLMKLYSTEKSNITIALTESERAIVYGESCKVISSLYTILWDIDPSLFKEKIYEAMGYLGIVFICQELGTEKYGLTSLEENKQFFKIDEFQIFLNNFYKYMKGGGH